MISVCIAQDAQKRLDMLKTLINTPFSAVSLERERDSKITALQAPVKDEFETQTQFEKRKQESVRLVQQISQEYEQEIAAAHAIFDRRIEEIKQEREQFLATTEENISSSFTIGTYNPEEEKFPITVMISGQSDWVVVPQANAKAFKSSVSKLSAGGKRRLTADGNWEYYNWTISYPIAGATYAFGPKRGVSPSYITSKKSGLPPALSMTVELKEPSGNKKLDAEERGEIALKITNSGKGDGVGFEVLVLTEKVTDITIPSSIYVGEIPAGKTVSASIPLQASGNLADGNVSVTLTPKEAQGFAPAPVKVMFETKALVPPQLAIADLVLENNSGSGIIKPGEIQTITVRIGNKGRGAAQSVNARITLGANVFFAEGSSSSFAMGTLESGKTYDAKFSIYTNLQATEVPMYMSVSESRGKYGIVNYRLPLEFNKRVAAIEQITVKGKDEQTGTVELMTGLSIDVDVNIPKIEVAGQNKIAIIFGVEQYRNVTSVPYAKRDAAVMRDYAVRVLGVPDDKNHLYYRTDDEVSRNEFEKLFSENGWLSKRVDPSTDVIIYYAGHGAPDLKDKSPYLIPSDGDPNYPAQTGFSLNRLYEELGKLNAKSITVFLDACFSGVTRDNKMLFADARPIRISIANPALTSDRITVFTASGGEQISSGYPEKKHGLFTYFLLKGLRGDADVNKDKNLTISELERYLIENVPKTAGLLDREQKPEVLGKNKEKVLVKY